MLHNYNGRLVTYVVQNYKEKCLEATFVQNNLAFNIPIYTQDNSTFPKPVNEKYDYWSPLILEKSDTIEIHCWNDEIDIIEDINTLSLNTFEMFQEDNITIFKGKKTFALSNYLLNDYTNNMGEFKWFTVNLDIGPTTPLHSH